MNAEFNEWFHRNYIAPLASNIEAAERLREPMRVAYRAGFRMGKKYGTGEYTL